MSCKFCTYSSIYKKSDMVRQTNLLYLILVNVYTYTLMSWNMIIRNLSRKSYSFHDTVNHPLKLYIRPIYQLSCSTKYTCKKYVAIQGFCWLSFGSSTQIILLCSSINLSLHRLHLQKESIPKFRSNASVIKY